MLGFLKKEHCLLSIADGSIMDITRVPDQVFSQKFLGDGFAVLPETGDFVSPCDGTITDVTKTLHAYCVLTCRNFATFNRYSELSNGRCPTGYKMIPLVPLWYAICVYAYAHTRTLTMMQHESILYSAWASRCRFYYSGQCEGLQSWNWQMQVSRFFYVLKNNDNRT